MSKNLTNLTFQIDLLVILVNCMNCNSPVWQLRSNAETEFKERLGSSASFMFKGVSCLGKASHHPCDRVSQKGRQKVVVYYQFLPCIPSGCSFRVLSIVISCQPVSLSFLLDDRPLYDGCYHSLLKIWKV